MNFGFEKWWQEEGRWLDPDTSDVPWFDKRQGLAEMAFEAGIKCGMARAGNYTANTEIDPTVVEFANGRTVSIGALWCSDRPPCLVIGKRESKV